MSKTTTPSPPGLKLRTNSLTESPSSEDAAPYSRRFALLACAALLAVVAAYANHFHNSFHFDDSHTVVNNIYIRDLRNIPRFFTDGKTFSSLPTNQSWRPLVSVSLAIDYYLAGGLNPLWFHVSTFFWFLVQLVLMFFLYESLLQATLPQRANRYIALLTTTWYGLHPVNAETINYIIQRGDLYATLGVVAGLVIYIRLPRLRKFGLYLLPVVLGSMAKPPAVVFCGILLVFIFLWEENADWSRWWTAVRKAIPALVVCGFMAFVNLKLTPKSYVPGTTDHFFYWITQPFVILRFVRSLFLPFWLSADTDLRPFTSLADGRALIGIGFCLALLYVAFRTAKYKEFRPISFGIFWFFCALAPTSVVALSEVENDHRMFFPFVGLMLSVTWTLSLVVSRYLASDPERRRQKTLALRATALVLLLLYAIGTRARNEVWHTDESLWRDVTIKSPHNGRGLMNYGLTLMGKGDAQGALNYFNRALKFTPDYYVLEINLGIVYGLLNHPKESEYHFRRAISLAPNEAQPYFYYGRWSKTQGRTAEYIVAEKSAIEKNPAYMDARYLLLQAYLEQAQWEQLKDLAQDTLRLWPGDRQAQQYLALSTNHPREPVAVSQLAQQQVSPEYYLNLSLNYNRAGKYRDSIAAAHKALQLEPDYAEAYNNIAAAYEALHEWDPAIRAAEKAVQLKPNFQLAKNNLAWSRAQKRKAGGH